MQPVVRSVNVGGPRGGILPKGRDTGIGKRPVEAIELGDPGPGRGGLGSGVVEDVVSRTHHGGSYQADDAVVREELDRWGGELVRDPRDEAGRSSVVRRPGGRATVGPHPARRPPKRAR